MPSRVHEIRARYTPGDTQFRDVGKCTLQDIQFLLAKLVSYQRREQALTAFAIRTERDYMECDKMFIHVGSLKQDTGYNAYLIDAKQSGARPLTFEQWLRGQQEVPNA